MMAANTMRTTSPRLTRRRIPTRTPARQTLPRTKTQHQIPLRPTNPHLTPRWRFPPRPHNLCTALISRDHTNRAPPKCIAKNIRQIIPYLLAVEIIREDGLTDVGLVETVFYGGDFDSDAAGDGVAVEGFGI